jgi:hypothetical protein
MIDIEAQKSLAVELFELTGYKVGIDDPSIIAALFFSERIRAMQSAHHKLIEGSLAENRAQMQVAIDAAVKQLARQADSGRAKLEVQYSEILSVAKNAAHNEVPVIKRDLAKFAAELRKASLPKPKDTFTMTLAALGGSMALTALGSVLATAIWFGKLDIVAVKDSMVAYAHQAQPDSNVSGSPATEKKAGQR